METARFLKIVIIALLLINTATLAFMWMQNRPGGPIPPRESVFDFLTRELKLDEEQRRQYEALRDEHHAMVEELQHTSRQLHQQYFSQLHGAKTDSATILDMAENMAGIQKQIDLITFYHFQKVRTICRPEQQKRFDVVIEEALRMMAPRPPHGPGRLLKQN